MSTGRQDPDYPVGDSVRDSLALLSAMLLEGPDSALVDEALENALDGTDHTTLTYNLGLLGLVLLGMAADARGQDRLDLLRELAAAAGQAALQDDEEGPA